MRGTVRISSLFVSCLAALLFCAPLLGRPDSPAPGTASGTFAVDGKSISVRYAYAMAQPNPFDEKKSDTAILVTDKPIAEDELAKLKDLESAGRGAKRNSVLFVLDESGRSTREVVHHEALGEDSLQMSGMTHSDFTPDSQTKDRIAGAIRTKGSEEFLKHKYATDLRFNASIRQAKREEPLPDVKSGQKLPPGGGEPGKAYFAFQDAIRRKDIAAIRKLKPADVPDMSDDDLKKALELMAAMAPTKVTITEGYVNGDTASLYLTGMQGGEKQYGAVRMNRSGGVWRATEEKWSNTPPGK